MSDWHPDIPEEYRNQIVTGDARELAKRIPDGSVALSFFDPPYWVGFDYGYAKDTQIDRIAPKWIVSEGLRVARVLLVTCGFVNMYEYPKPDHMLIWRKGNAMKRYAWGFLHWEPVLAYGKPSLPQNKMRPDVYDAPIIVDGKYDGKTPPKPLKLMIDLILTFTNPQDIVIDFCCGTGTTLKAAKLTGRDFIGFEIDPDTARLARERVQRTQPPLVGLNEAMQQAALFDTETPP